MSTITMNRRNGGATGGIWTVTTAALSVAIARYLPASPAELRALVEERIGAPVDRDLDVAELLIVLADMDHNVDHDPLRAY